MTPEESLITSELRALVGQETEAWPVVVTPGAVRRGVEALFGGDELAEFQPGDDLPDYVLIALQAEGPRLHPPDVMPDQVEVGNEVTFERPFRLGETVFISSRLGNITERFGGRFGYSLMMRMETEYRDADRALIARTAYTSMQYDAANARS